MSSSRQSSPRPGAEDGESRTTLRQLILRYLGRLARLLLVAAIYALVVWYGLITTENVDAPPVPVKIAVGIIALGITGSIYNILIALAKEAKGAIMVLAEFLNAHLLEPQKRRLRAQGYAEGRAEGLTEMRDEVRTETLAEVRSALQKGGINLDDYLPPNQDDGDTPRQPPLN